MKKFILGLRKPAGSGAVYFNITSLSDKLAGYWINGSDQLATSNLVDSGTAYTMPVSTELQDATELISLNTWFVSGAAQTINKTSIANYCAGKQFYGKGILVILKKGSYLTEAEESGLLSYLEISSSHAYHANSVALFSRFVNTYTNKEKSRLDNVMRWISDSGIYAVTDHWYLSLTSKSEEMRLDWKNPSNNLTDNGYSVKEVPNKGLAPQKGTYYTGADPSTDANISQNSAYLSFKFGMDFSLPTSSYIFKGGNISMRPYRIPAGIGYDIRLMNSNPFYFAKPSGGGYDKTAVVNRTGAGATNIYINGSIAHTSGAASVTPVSEEMKIGGEIGTRGNSNSQFIQHLAWGGELTSSQSLLLNNLIDDFAAHQKYLDTPYVEVDGIRVTVIKDAFKCVLGQTCIWNDDDTVYYSTDLGDTVSASIALPTAGKYIDFAHIFDNGKIIFSTTENKIYKTTTALSTLTEMTPPLTIHTPVDSNYPGNYYRGLRMGQNKSYMPDGREIRVGGNYCNVFSGASPVFLWYSYGDDIKLAFEYGQNQYMTDNGSFIPNTGGNLLGDASEPTKTRHIHSVHQDPNSLNDFYFSTGDFDRTEFYESMIGKLTFDGAGENPIFSVAAIGSQYTKVKVSSVDFADDGDFIFASDASYNETNFNERGWFKTPVANIGDPSLWSRVFYQGDTEPITLLNMFSSNFALGGNAATGGTPGDFNNPLITFSEDLGVNTFTKNLNIPGNVFYPSTVEVSPKVFVFLVMTDYFYQGMYSIKVDLTNANDLTL